MSAAPPGGYWNHNTHHHGWLLSELPARVGTAVDVGCGDGLLLERLAPRCAEVVGLEPDPATAERARARARTAGLGHVRVETTGLLEWPAADGSVDVVCAVASLHHLDLVAALERVRRLLRPGGLLVVVGLAREQGWADHVAGALDLVGARLLEARHGGARDPGVPVRDVALSRAETRDAFRAVLPGVRLRRRALWRYGAVWRRPV
ncbi:class I SAM-dependent methyltransferase [Microlunatus capsulatus]|uniref:SAM-dependent methyltransferase n=1 Tax=Microlunatus capsulatus TaxID=99117 RepID=A0ABS4Z5Q5_9ACTN|nr:class I SAM-dependent methyltransferase [Microlunatus capsulatus]MBP2416279.1 SAM-dependent methyltransferase [Microlunatus capsulatus]